MDLFSTIVLLTIFVETSAMTVKTFVGQKIKSARHPRRKVFVDTSILMDGRILSVAKAGFLGDDVLIPRCVIRELQLLADGNDSEKRTRARYGLDVANELERIELSEVSIFTEGNQRGKVDECLIELAREYRGIIMTNDYNLAKVAATELIDVITVNDLAQGLRSEYLPGDKLNVKIISVGSNPKQGLAYLPDGTMIVVDDAERYAGTNQRIDIIFERYLQTAAGRMMFAKIAKPSTKTTKAKITKSGRARHGVSGAKSGNEKGARKSRKS
ncbi:hypothetical protein IJ102_02050 [Candidatus Saccharibacteria bacterium]|nr:hypothetical protein [Candidatus Saccharibacteria bacterium]